MAITYSIHLIPDEKLDSIIPFIQQLNPGVPEPTLTSRLAAMHRQGYQCAGLYAEEHLIGICGLWILTKFYVGTHIEPDNVYILPTYRGQGLGRKLLQWVYEYGISQGCIASELNCYLANETGNAFWEQEGFEKIGYHYQKRLASS